MKQSRLMSLVESVANVVVGYGVAVVTQILIFPIFGLHTTLAQNLKMASAFSFDRSEASISRASWSRGAIWHAAGYRDGAASDSTSVRIRSSRASSFLSAARLKRIQAALTASEKS